MPHAHVHTDIPPVLSEVAQTVDRVIIAGATLRYVSALAELTSAQAETLEGAFLRLTGGSSIATAADITPRPTQARRPHQRSRPSRRLSIWPAI